MTSDAIHVEKVGHFFSDDTGKKIDVLHDISFTVHPGEFFTILGPSGCGKSTLLRIIAGMMRPSRGRVVTSVADTPDALTMIFQSFALFPWLTVEDNVSFGLRMKGMNERVYVPIVREHIHEIGLSGFEKTYPKDLSGGMKQRVGIARALAMDPKILLMDEAFSALDAFTAEKLRAEVADIWLRDKMTVCMVTHSIEEAIEMSDRVLVMSPRPGHVEAVVDIVLPRPRSKRSKEFFDLVDRLRGLVRV